jgi:uncharacterized protein YidB (DUF937 family)
MSGLLDQLRQGGLGDQVSSWCQGAASNVAPDQIRGALGEQHVQAIANQLGISTDDVAQQLSEHLPAMAQAHAAADEQGAGAAPDA